MWCRLSHLPDFGFYFKYVSRRLNLLTKRVYLIHHNLIYFGISIVDFIVLVNQLSDVRLLVPVYNPIHQASNFNLTFGCLYSIHNLFNGCSFSEHITPIPLPISFLHNYLHFFFFVRYLVLFGQVYVFRVPSTDERLIHF